jgi:nitrogen fixation protein NifB
MLGAAQSAELVDILQACANGPKDGDQKRQYFAVASMEGILVNQHLGEAQSLWIFETSTGRPRLVTRRDTPPPGTGMERWRKMAESICDCHTVLVSGIGGTPKTVLEEAGLRVIEMAGLISDGVDNIVRTGNVPPSMKKVFKSCGSECQGAGMGCS